MAPFYPGNNGMQFFVTVQVYLKATTRRGCAKRNESIKAKDGEP